MDLGAGNHLYPDVFSGHVFFLDLFGPCSYLAQRTDRHRTLVTTPAQRPAQFCFYDEPHNGATAVAAFLLFTV